MPPAPPTRDLPRIDPADELLCLGHEEDVASREGALMPPIVPASLFAFPTAGALHQALGAEHEQTVYTRGRNPTVRAVEDIVAELERGESARLMGSGMGAVSMVLFGLLEAGDHVLFVNDIYGPTLTLASRLRRFGISFDQIHDGDIESIESAMRPKTKLIWLESPGTMRFRRLDLASIADLARSRGVRTVIDNSWATPLFQKPIESGINLVVHSATKYLAGHSDVVAGAVVGEKTLLDQLFYDAYLLLGAALSPFDAYLVARGLRTLPVRMRRHHESALAIAHFLADHPRVAHVFHPGLATDIDDQYEPSAAPSTLRGFSGLFSFVVDAGDSERGDATAVALVDRLDRFRIGVSWGGVESLALVLPPEPDAAERADATERGLPLGLVRLSIGLEDPAILIADLDSALAAVSS